jgi:hypothetical protein
MCIQLRLPTVLDPQDWALTIASRKGPFASVSLVSRLDHSSEVGALHALRVGTVPWE